MPRLQYQIKAEPILTSFAEQVTEDRWHQPWSEPVRVMRDPNASIALSAASGNTFWPLPIPNSNPGVIVSTYFNPLSEPVRVAPRLQAGLNQFTALTHAPPYPESVTYDRWHYSWSEPVWLKPDIGAARQQFQPQNPFGQTQPESVLESKWHYSWSEPVRLNPDIGAARQQFLQFQLPGGIPEAPLFKFGFAWSEPVRLMPRLQPGLNQFIAQTHAPPYPETATYDRWGYPWSEPVRIRPGLKAGQQLTTVFGAPPSSEAVLESKWHQAWSDPVRIKPGLRPELQQPFASVVDVDTPVIGQLSWYNWFSEPVRVPARLLAGAQPFMTVETIVPQFADTRLIVRNTILRLRTVQNS